MPRFKMKCGHTANATDAHGYPVCVICLGIKEGATEIDHEVHGNEGLEGRKARCPYCKKTTDSRWELPFFEHKPNAEYDEYYDGCFGWD